MAMKATLVVSLPRFRKLGAPLSEPFPDWARMNDAPPSLFFPSCSSDLNLAVSDLFWVPVGQFRPPASAEVLGFSIQRSQGRLSKSHIVFSANHSLTHKQHNFPCPSGKGFNNFPFQSTLTVNVLCWCAFTAMSTKADQAVKRGRNLHGSSTGSHMWKGNEIEVGNVKHEKVRNAKLLAWVFRSLSIVLRWNTYFQIFVASYYVTW